MKQQIEGSSKVFYEHKDNLFLMTFKDDIHGANRQDSIAGTGALRKLFTYYFYRYLEKNGVPTHLATIVDTLNEQGIVVKKCKPVKLEVLVRNVARGHWVDDHKIPIFEGGTVFDEPIVEFCIKMKEELPDGRIIDDPRVNSDVAIALHNYAKDDKLRGRMIINEEEAEQLRQMALAINKHYKAFLLKHGWILEDFKFETGIVDGDESRTFLLIDEISPDSSRIRDAEGNSLTKDLFRQRRDEREIYDSYKLLADSIKEAYQSS